MERRSNRIRVPIHFVWATHDRLPLIAEGDEKRLYRYIETICRDLRCDVLAVGGMPDHVHLLVNYGSMVSLSELMKRVKGGSSRFMSQELKSGAWFQWQGHYGATSVEPSGIPTVVTYINNQKQHHADGTIRPELEETFEITEIRDDPPGA